MVIIKTGQQHLEISEPSCVEFGSWYIKIRNVIVGKSTALGPFGTEQSAENAMARLIGILT